jgi:hypothetical protein
MTERPTKTEDAQANGAPVHASVLVQAKKDPLQRKREQRDKLIGLRDELLQESLGVIRDSMRFRDIDPEAFPERENDPAFWNMEDALGPEDAKRAYRVAKYALATAADAPIGLKLATNIAVGIMKANAAEKGAAPILNVGKVIISANSIPVFEEREVENE